MRRILMLLTVAALMAAMVVVAASLAFAAVPETNERANCVGLTISNVNQEGKDPFVNQPGLGGRALANTATDEETGGRFIGREASSNCADVADGGD
jgi:hypothetical protein